MHFDFLANDERTALMLLPYYVVVVSMYLSDRINFFTLLLL